MKYIRFNYVHSVANVYNLYFLFVNLMCNLYNLHIYKIKKSNTLKTIVYLLSLFCFVLPSVCTSYSMYDIFFANIFFLNNEICELPFRIKYLMNVLSETKTHSIAKTS